MSCYHDKEIKIVLCVYGRWTFYCSRNRRLCEQSKRNQRKALESKRWASHGILERNAADVWAQSVNSFGTRWTAAPAHKSLEAVSYILSLRNVPKILYTIVFPISVQMIDVRPVRWRES